MPSNTAWTRPRSTTSTNATGNSPTGDLVDFLRGCGARRIAGPQPCGHANLTDSTTGSPTLPDLIRAYRRLRAAAGLPSRSPSDVARRLQPVLDAVPAEHAGAEPVGAFLKTLDDALDLTILAAASPQLRDHTALAELKAVDETTGLSLEQFAGPKLAVGKVILTTYHSAKGCEYSVVILPGLVEGLVPWLSWSRQHGRYEEPARAVMAEQRRTFYVAVTRAAHSVILIYGPYWENWVTATNSDPPASSWTSSSDWGTWPDCENGVSVRIGQTLIDAVDEHANRLLTSAASRSALRSDRGRNIRSYDLDERRPSPPTRGVRCGPLKRMPTAPVDPGRTQRLCAKARGLTGYGNRTSTGRISRMSTDRPKRTEIHLEHQSVRRDRDRPG
jgi:hypothetical protein